MKALLDNLRGMNSPTAECAADEIERLTAKVAELEKKAARYDWLTEDMIDYEESPGVTCYMICDRMFYGASKDDAIDAAMLADAARRERSNA